MEDVSGPDQRRGERGFSLIEVLMASALLFIVLIGLVPLFLQSVLNNASGNESSKISNAARSAAEQFMALDFNHPALVVTSGLNNQSVQHFDRVLHRWVSGAATSPGRAMERTVTVRQFQLRDLEDNGKLDTPFASPPAAGNALNIFPVHLREIEVEVTGRLATAGALRRVLNKTVTIRALRGF